MITFDNKGFKINGEDDYLISGEFPYFRVPKADWKRRMQLFIEAGGNCLATYIPWVVHEPEEGHIVFGDCDQRDLTGFLETVQEAGLQIIVRPGPYVYTEVTNAGIPTWLIDGHPEVLALTAEGKPIRDYAASYLHPVFLEKARKYYRAVAEVIRPYLAENGGPIAMVQVDNELTGIHLWSDSMDYNPATIGLGDENGRYAKFLKKTYGTIEALNESYEVEFPSFATVTPVGKVDQTKRRECRRLRDYSRFYREMMSEYLQMLVSWLREDGITSQICHNSGTPTMNCLFEETVRDFNSKGEKFLLGSDHYYTLGQHWSENNPSPKYALRMLMSCDTLRTLGMPPMAMELPGGSCADTPPILANDMLASYMTNLAMGLKGLNYYIFTGGPNFGDTGATCEIYDFCAPVAADGTVREDKYAAIKTLGDFAHSHKWMQRTRRFASVQVGFEWNTLRSMNFDWSALPIGGGRADSMMTQMIFYTLMCSKFSGEYVELSDELDPGRPLIVPTPSMMSKTAQERIKRFIEDGGRALILPVLPETDLNYCVETTLAGLFADAEFERDIKLAPYIKVKGMAERVYDIHGTTVVKTLPAGANAIVEDAEERVIAFEKQLGAGKAIFFGGTFLFTTFPQAKMLETLLERLDAEPAIEHDNRNIFTALWKRDAEHGTIFLMNLYSSPQSTGVKLGGQDFGTVELAAMEVKTVDY